MVVVEEPAPDPVETPASDTVIRDDIARISAEPSTDIEILDEARLSDPDRSFASSSPEPESLVAVDPALPSVSDAVEAEDAVLALDDIARTEPIVDRDLEIVDEARLGDPDTDLSRIDAAADERLAVDPAIPSTPDEEAPGFGRASSQEETGPEAGSIGPIEEPDLILDETLVDASNPANPLDEIIDPTSP